MCNFLSVDSNGDGVPLYFNAELRGNCRRKELPYDYPDSHTSIADYFGFGGAKEDTLNKYEYNVFTKRFTVDQRNNPVDDSAKIEAFCRELDITTVVPELRLHPIVNPFVDIQTTAVTKEDVELLRQWASVWASVKGSVWASVKGSVWASVGASVKDSVWASVGASVGASVWASVGASVWASVWASVGASVWASVWASVGASVGASVWESVRDSVWAYVSSFFDLPEWKYVAHEPGVNPFQSAIDLWNRGIVPSFDGKSWRLHGAGGKVLYEDAKGAAA